ncbi:MAG: hypothetical protein ACK5TI_01920, partial [bacterium]
RSAMAIACRNSSSTVFHGRWTRRRSRSMPATAPAVRRPAAREPNPDSSNCWRSRLCSPT